jgi:hypothetical protein
MPDGAAVGHFRLRVGNWVGGVGCCSGKFDPDDPSLCKQGMEHLGCHVFVGNEELQHVPT